MSDLEWVIWLAATLGGTALGIYLGLHPPRFRGYTAKLAGFFRRRGRPVQPPGRVPVRCTNADTGEVIWGWRA